MRQPIQTRALTLTELLVVVGVIGVLAVIAIPSVLEAMTRSKVSAARAQQRVLAGAISSYHIDHNHFPAIGPDMSQDPLGILADVQLSGLTTPVTYVAPTAFSDPFGQVRLQSLQPGGPAASSGPSGGPGDFPIPTQSVPNPKKSYLYIHYPTFAARTDNPSIGADGIAIISLGPDLEDSFGTFAPFPSTSLPALAPAFGIDSPLDTLYDPTNGTSSKGDIPRTTGQLPPVPGN